ncbi:AAA family ATPase [Aliamphritea spongicola]
MNANTALQGTDQLTNELIPYLKAHMNARIVGQERFVDRLLLALFADGHILLEGAPGLAKTKAVNALAEAIDCDARRIQFTPDLLPSDLTGTDIYRPEQQSFTFQEGPLFNSLILADEINRAPAKVQSALLEAMAERQITVGGKTYPLPALFLVMATQNPIEQEGTYPLPEAQLDRFLLHVNIDFPSAEAEREILRIVHGEARGEVTKPQRLISADEILLPVSRHWRPMPLNLCCNTSFRLFRRPAGHLCTAKIWWMSSVTVPARGVLSRWTAVPGKCLDAGFRVCYADGCTGCCS